MNAIDMTKENPMQDEINALRQKCQTLQTERDRAVETADVTEQARQATFDQMQTLRLRVEQAEDQLVQKLVAILKSGRHTEVFKSAVAEQLAQHLLVEKNHGKEIGEMLALVQAEFAALGWNDSLNEKPEFRAITGRLDDVIERLQTYYVVHS